jgi:hypothetical protein
VSRDDEQDTGEPSQASYDAVTTRLLQRIAANTVDPGMYQRVMADMTDVERGEVEAAVERHAARRRARGEPGW